MRTTEQNLEKIFSDRLKTVAEAVKTNHFDAAYFANLPRENAYKIVSRYARVLYNKVANIYKHIVLRATN